MRRLAAIGLALAAPLAAARADMAAAAALKVVDITAGDLTFLIHRDATPTRPSPPTAQLIGCVDGRPNCAVAQANGLIGRWSSASIDAASIPGVAVASQILDAFNRDARRRRSKTTSSPKARPPNHWRVSFARR